MKRLFFVAAFVCGMFTATFADNEVNVLYLDGTPHVIKMTDIDKIEFSAGSLSVAKTDGSSETHAIKDIDKITFDGILTAVDKTKKAAAGDITVKANGYAFEVSGLQDNADVAVYTQNGMLVGKAKASDGSARVDASGYSAGVYIIKAGGRSLKMIKK